MNNNNLMFMGTVHNCAGIQENVFGFTKDQVIQLARDLKTANNDFKIVHIYTPVNMDNRNYIGYELL